MRRVGTNWKNWGGILAMALGAAVVSAAISSRVWPRTSAVRGADAAARPRTIEVRPLKVDASKLKWGNRDATAFEVRDTAAGTSWLVLKLDLNDPGIVLPLPAAPSRIVDILPEPR